MRAFEHVNPASMEDVLATVGEDWQTRLIAGGTDLLPLMKKRIVAPSRLVNLKTVDELAHLDFSDEGGLVMGALAKLEDVARNPVVRQRYRVLAEAIAVAASPQLRNMATVGGNLCQTSRCWYYRGPFFCWLRGGEKCYAADGENQFHALFGGGPCYSAHPSDPAPALIALGAEVTLYNSKGGSRAMPLQGLYAMPTEERRRETVLKPNELVVRVQVPTPDAKARGSYLKAMARETFAFALASVAVQGVWDGPVAQEISIVLGGVAPIPWRAAQAEDVVRGQPVDGRIAREAGEAAVAGAQPLQHNGYKLELVRTVVERALIAAAAPKGKHSPVA
ncbi:MAG: FAD binding domain-containing protein [Chloroflexota bacterium]